MEKLVSLKAEKAVTEHGTAEINKLNDKKQLMTYATALSNPNLSDTGEQKICYAYTPDSVAGCSEQALRCPLS